MKTILLILLLVAVGPQAHGLVGGGHPVTIEVSKTKDGKEAFEVVNLTKKIGPVEAARWIFNLHHESEGKERYYSNSVHLNFAEGFKPDEIKRVWAIFELNKVYVLKATVAHDGKRVPFEEKPSALNELDAMLEAGDLTPEEKKVLRELRPKLKNAEQVGAGRP